MRNLTEHELVDYEKGLHAKLLLESQPFAAAINDLSEELANKMLSTKIEERTQREDHYLQHTNLIELVSILRGRSSIYEQLHKEISDPEDDLFTEQ